MAGQRPLRAVRNDFRESGNEALERRDGSTPSGVRDAAVITRLPEAAQNAATSARRCASSS